MMSCTAEPPDLRARVISFFWTSLAWFSILTVLSMMSCTAEPPDLRARVMSFFWLARSLCTACTFSLAAMAESMLASASAILSSNSFLYLENWVHLRFGLMHIQSCIHFQCLAIWKALRALWQE